MGRKLDLSGLTDNEAEHVLQVVQRDMKLRKEEEKRLSELKQDLNEEGNRCLLLSRQRCFNQRCCIRCCSPFTFLLNPKRQCGDCRYNVCKACRVYNKRDKAWLCCACQKSRLLKTQTVDWFYTNVKMRFKRYGSAKVLKTLYRKHLAERGALSELTEGSAYEESVNDEGSVCESDSTFYRQSEERSMSETLTVALRVAEEAVDEAISKAEFDTGSQEKQSEAHYLREHRGELTEELAQSIVQKIITWRKTLTEMRAESDQDWPLEQNTNPHHHHHQSVSHQASSLFKHQPNLWRSRSTFSLLDKDRPGLIQDFVQDLTKKATESTLSAWKSVDRLDNAGRGVSSVLKSPDGNWMALQSVQLSCPSLLSKRKSLVSSALERESGVVSAYEDKDTDDNTLEENHREKSDSKFNLQDTSNWILLSGRRGNRDNLFSDSEGKWKDNKPLLPLHKRKGPMELRRPSASLRTNVIDVNFHAEAVTQDEDMASGGAAEPEAGQVRRSRRKRKSKKDQAAVSSAPVSSENNNQLQPHFVAVTYRPVTPAVLDQSDVTGRGANQKDGELMLKLQQLPESNTPEAELDKDRDFGDDGEREEISEEKDEEDECLWTKDIESDGGRTDAEKEEEEEEEDGDLEVDEEMKLRLHRLVQQSRLTYLSSTDDELDKFGQSERESVEDMEKDNYDQGEGLTYKLCQLEKEVKATQFSSTEDELDRVGAEDERRGKEDGSNVELAVRVCRLAHQVNATMFSSTEDELDGAGGDGERGMDEETLWELQAEKAVQAAQLRDLASLVSASQFSSTEDELDRAEKEEEVTQRTADQGGIYISFETEEGWDGTTERRESFADLDVKMFDLRDETEEETKETRERQEVKLKKAETVDLSESKVEKPENRPEGNGGESNTDQETQEETAGSEEEDAEFDRIISSMLTLTLEDMQGDTLKEDATEDGRVNTERQQTETGGRPESTGDTDTQLMSGNTKQQEDGDMDAQEAGSVAHDEEHADGRGNKCKPKKTDRELEREKRADLTEPRVTSSLQERLQSPQEIQQRYSAVSLCSITTEMLKVLNATEELLQEVEGGEATRLSTTSLPPNTDPKKLDHQFSRLEENVYVTAGSVYSLEAELSDLEECARGISSATSDMELSFLEEQVASAAAKVRQSELQVCNIAARIASLKSAGLNVDTQSRVMTVTPDSLPALPQREDKDLSH